MLVILKCVHDGLSSKQ